MEGYEIRRRVARFRGARLIQLGAIRSGGKRIDLHEFWLREIPYAEEGGRRPRRFSFRGVVIGPDHDLQADELERLFEMPGAGEFATHHSGPFLVQVEDYRFEEPERDTRIQRYEVQFVEAGAPIVPEARPDTSGRVQGRVAEAFATAAAAFADVFTLSDQTQAQIDRVVEIARDAAEGLEVAFEAIRAGAEIVEEIAAYSQSLAALGDRIAQTIVDGAVAAAEFQNQLDAVFDLPLQPLEIYRQLEDVAAFGESLLDPGTETVARTLYKRNQDAVVRLIRESTTIARTKALARAEFESSTDAAEFRQAIADELAERILTASDAFQDDVVDDLRRVRASILTDLDVRAARLPGRVTYRVRNQLPAIIVAQILYGDPERDQEIIDRNPLLIPNPGRIPGESELEVLAGG